MNTTIETTSTRLWPERTELDSLIEGLLAQHDSWQDELERDPTTLAFYRSHKDIVAKSNKAAAALVIAELFFALYERLRNELSQNTIAEAFARDHKDIVAKSNQAAAALAIAELLITGSDAS